MDPNNLKVSCEDRSMLGLLSLHTYIPAMRVVVNSGSRCGLLRHVGLFVVDGRQSMRLLRYRADRTDVRTHPHGICGLADGFYENVGALSHAQRYHRGGVRSNWHEIVRNHSHLVAVDGETLQRLGARVDESETVRLSGLELELGQTRVGDALGASWERRAIEITFAVDEVIV